MSLGIRLWGIKARTAYLSAHQDIIDESEHTHDDWPRKPLAA